jgi:hypothetical protein
VDSSAPDGDAAIWFTEHDQREAGRRDYHERRRAKKSIAAMLANRSLDDIRAAGDLLSVAFRMKGRRAQR